MKASPKKLLLSAIFLVMTALMLIILFGDNGLVELNRLRNTHRSMLETNAGLTQENVRLYRAIDRLQNDPGYVENIARRELGMVRPDEMIFKFKTTPQAK